MKSVDNNEIITKTTEFVTSGIRLLAQRCGEDVITWQIDGNGAVLGFVYNDEVYFYIKNAQGDIIGIVDEAGNEVATYIYDSWGKIVNENALSAIGKLNPLRYRGYYYDEETQLYYLNARYYDPETGRFLNADDNLEGGLNLFAYCYNNPVNKIDPSGKIPYEEYSTYKQAMLEALRDICKRSFGKTKVEEWGTLIYRNASGTYGYVEPRTDHKPTSVSLRELYNLIPKDGAILITRAHTHPWYKVVIDGNTRISGYWAFSDEDNFNSNLYKPYDVSSCVGTASGSLLFDPVHGVPIEVKGFLDVDSNLFDYLREEGITESQLRDSYPEHPSYT